MLEAAATTAVRSKYIYIYKYTYYYIIYITPTLTLLEGGRCFQAVDMTIVFDIFMVRERVPLHQL